MSHVSSRVAGWVRLLFLHTPNRCRVDTTIPPLEALSIRPRPLERQFRRQRRSEGRRSASRVKADSPTAAGTERQQNGEEHNDIISTRSQTHGQH